ncbi:MAG: hypothetical protein JWQ78_602 [Sediminibacterium sp.]|nr:hypothetical protein [Sediminibacterium sp.]
MKKSILLTTCLSLMACICFAQTKKTDPKEDTIQYSLGVYMMQQFFAKTGFVVTNPTLFEKAIDDVLKKKPLMVNAATTQNRLLAYQQNFQQLRGQQQEALLFSRLQGTPGYTALPSGVNYAVITRGKGIRPTAKDTVILNVITTLPDGTVVNDSNKSKQSYITLAGDMIAGLKEVLYRLEEGSIVRAIIPASQAYGSAGSLTIPPNSALIFDIALVSVKPGR